MRGSLFVFLSCVVLSSSCGSSGVGGILCGSGHAQGKMTVGLNLPFFSLNKAGEDDGNTSDEGIKSFLNSGLEKVGVSKGVFSVKNVESVIPGDSVRFLELGGTFGAGFGVATSLLKNAFSSDDKMGSPFDFLNEDFNVQAARHFFHSDTAQGHEFQWAYLQTNFDKAMELYSDLLAFRSNDAKSTPPVVAVLDTGVDLSHPDLKDILLDGYDALDTSTGADDENGHGTHCAGIIAAQKTSDASPLGVATIADTKIRPVKVLGKDGGGSFQAIEKGIRWAMDQGVDVISLSLGAGLEFDQMGGLEALRNGVISDAIASNVIVVAAAGNENCQLAGTCRGTGLFRKSFENYTVVPCAYDGMICIGASNADETLASYSNYSSKRDSEGYRTRADINAPGTAIYSTWPTSLPDSNGYRTISGTSMATPYVAGIAALLRSLEPNLSQAKFLEYLKEGQAMPPNIVERSDVGRVDLYAVLIAYANDIGFDDAPQDYEPQPVDVGEHEPPVDGGGGNIVSSLLSAVCR